ncbi:MAG TPA: alpha/beta hydrolase [Pseudonocardiaceae bacterium]
MRFRDRIDPEVAAALPAVPVLDLTDIPAARVAREQLAAQARARMPADPSVAREDHLVATLDGSAQVRVRHYRPANRPAGPLPCLYWIHGGGHVLGSVDQDDPFLESVVRTLGCAAVSVDWRRAPEHPFPTPLEDCYTGLLWTARNAERLGLDPDRIAIGGASSGGGSAAGLALLARDRGQVRPAFQLLIYPMLDDRTDSDLVDHPKLWGRVSNLIAWRAYLGHEPGERDGVSPYAVPARATELGGLPPAFVATGDLDLFADEDIEYARRLVRAGVPVELHVYPGGIHGFDLFAPDSGLARRLVRDRDEALARVLGHCG